MLKINNDTYSINKATIRSIFSPNEIIGEQHWEIFIDSSPNHQFIFGSLILANEKTLDRLSEQSYLINEDWQRALFFCFVNDSGNIIFDDVRFTFGPANLANMNIFCKIQLKKKDRYEILIETELRFSGYEYFSLSELEIEQIKTKYNLDTQR